MGFGSIKDVHSTLLTKHFYIIDPRSTNELKRRLEEIQKMSNKVEGIIELFSLISPYHDKDGFRQTIFKLQEKNHGQLDIVINALETLQEHFKNAGRCEYGMNRTSPGEQVTAAKVFLGDVFGIWTKSAEYWLSHKEEFEKDIREDLTNVESRPISTWYCINDYKAGGFIKSHVDGMIRQIGILSSYLKKS